MDAYIRRTRYQPGLLAVAPVAVLLIGLGWQKSAWAIALSGLSVQVGLPFFLAGVVRSLGERVQDDLYATWGGPPTSRFLRHTSTESTAADRDRWHARLARVAGRSLPTADEERSDPQGADEIYDTVTADARELTRGPNFPLVAAENISYGFWRNMRGLRPWGLWLSVGMSIVAFAAVAAAAGGGAPGPRTALIAALLAELALVAVWAAGPTEARVANAADKYARQLFNALPAT